MAEVSDALDDSQFICDEHDGLPTHLLHERSLWQRQYQEEIEELYQAYLANGRQMFGRAFHQLGTVKHFADFVFKYMQPGGVQV